MERKEADIRKSLSWRKMILPLVLGLSAAMYLLISSLGENRFFKVTPGEGDYEWQDSNNNGVADTTVPAEFVVTESGDYVFDSVQSMILQIDWNSSVFFCLFLALFTAFLRDFGYMYRIRVLTDKFFSWKEAFQVIMLWEFSSALTPSVVGGSGVAIFIMNREGLSLGKSTATMFVTALMDELFYIIMVPLVLLLAGGTSLFPDSVFGYEGVYITNVFWLGYGFLCLLTLVITLSLFFFPQGFKQILINIFSWKPLRRWIRNVVRLGNDVIISSEELKRKKFSFWFKAFSSTIISWTARFLTLNFVIMAFMGNIDQLFVYGRQLIMWVYMLVSPTPGSAGIAEIALAGFFENIVISAQYVALVAIIWRFLTYFPYLFIGAAVLPKWLSRTSLKQAKLKSE
ncbi:MAG: lysylphosphatidylglycerol synthase transmembrane domain-containing protein [Flavobacteriales bacterium]